jgi:hypothetical protein
MKNEMKNRKGCKVTNKLPDTFTDTHWKSLWGISILKTVFFLSFLSLNNGKDICKIKHTIIVHILFFVLFNIKSAISINNDHFHGKNFWVWKCHS